MSGADLEFGRMLAESGKDVTDRFLDGAYLEQLADKRAAEGAGLVDLDAIALDIKARIDDPNDVVGDSVRDRALLDPYAADLNAGDALLPGNWHTNDQTLNRPAGNFCLGYTLVYGGGANYRYQVAVDINSGDVFSRVQSVGTWSDWVTAPVNINIVDIYISPTGNDANDGTQGFPKQNINAAIASRINEPTRFILMGGLGNHVITQVIDLNASYHILYADTLVAIDCTAITTGPAVYITASIDPPYRQTKAVLENIELIGPGKATATTGIHFDNAAVGGQGPSHMGPRSINIHAFGTAIEFGNRTYVNDFFHFDMWDCGRGIFVPPGTVDSGERLTFHGGTIFNNTGVAVHAENRNSTVNLVGVSLDYNGAGRHIYCDGSSVNLYACHIEGSASATTPMFQIWGRSTVNMFGGVIVALTGSNQAEYMIDNNAVAGGYCLLEGVSLLNTTTLSGALATGNGKTVIRNCTGDDDAMQVVSFNDSLMADGDMEETTIVDDWYISDDTVDTGERHAGTNVIITKSLTEKISGVRSLRIEKVGGTGTAGEVTLLCPLGDGHRVWAKGLVSKPGVSSGTIAIRTEFAKVSSSPIPVTSGTLLTPYKSLIESVDFVMTASVATGWVDVLGSRSAPTIPEWATHFCITLDLTSWDANSDYIYIDDVVITTA